MKEFKLVLSEQEVNVLGVALGEIAFKLAAPVINKIQQQVNEQLQSKDSEA